jgi:energy-coupling factor transporter ATP-binding protein EcfA2
METKLIELKNICKSFDGEQVLSNVDLDIHDHEFITLLGPSGCGKTTTLRIIGGFESPDDGEVFFDGYGEFSKIRKSLSYLPEDVRLKKIAGNLLIMAQSGQYNYTRCIKRGESAAAQLAIHEFAKSTLHTAFLLNKRYLPYYKWSFRALTELSSLSNLYEPLEYLISSKNKDGESAKKQDLIESIARNIIEELASQGLTRCDGYELEQHAYIVNDKILSQRIRNLHILAAI